MTDLIPTPKPACSAPEASTSLIGRLPTELRLQIYNYLFPDKPVPSHPCDKGSFRADGQTSSTKVLRLNHAIHQEAQALLYSNVPFHVNINPGGIALCGGHTLAYPDVDPGKRGGPPKIRPVTNGPCEAAIRNARRLDVTIVAWVEYTIFDLVKQNTRHFVDRLADADPPLLDLKLAIEWHNGISTSPSTYPRPAMAKELLEPFERLKVRRSVEVGNLGTPRYSFGATASAVVKEEEYKVLKEELRQKVLVR
ncbi:hypothetical protein B0J12DRAFT_701383 [Macrophomina phaseolina]|uniref:Uncharacterized protein n=1 Tax=Macrophomina phaseolina TaxID=35725 RepID=A0ABQ8G8B8_9PEZI|nr:hypothetical protein B0J12DRAFT_701383 [Macrophomina phaseolina]